MEQIKAAVDSGGLISCQIPIDVQEWEAILSNPEITYTGYKTAIMAFYNAQGHTSTCKTKDSQGQVLLIREARDEESGLSLTTREAVPEFEKFVQAAEGSR